MRVLLKLVHPRPVRIEIDKLRTTVPVTKLVQPRIAHDDKQPALQIAVGIGPVRRAGGPQIGILHEVFGFRHVARQRQGIAVERVDVLHRRLTKFSNFNEAVHLRVFVAAILD